MRVFVDTEFTCLSDPILISIGAVDDEDRMFYGVVTDYPERACSPFVREHVLPHLMDPPPHFAGPHRSLGTQFVAWLRACSTERLEVVADDEADLELVRRLIHSARADYGLLDVGFRLLDAASLRPGLDRWYEAHPQAIRHRAADDARALKDVAAGIR